MRGRNVVLAATPGWAQVREFAPVSDAVLQDPDPADWLNWRRTLDGWGYSPLDEIDTSNAGELQLAWSWGIEPGVSQTTPLVLRRRDVHRQPRQRRARARRGARAT